MAKLACERFYLNDSNSNTPCCPLDQSVLQKYRWTIFTMPDAYSVQQQTLSYDVTRNSKHYLQQMLQDTHRPNYTDTPANVLIEYIDYLCSLVVGVIMD